jgi:sugar lactone lactonase YvrE
MSGLPISESTVVLDGLAFGEGPRWHDGRLWFSDMHAHEVLAFTPATRAVETIVEVPGAPSGLGWDRDGRLLIVSMDDRRLLRFDPDGDGLTEVADLSTYTAHPINDMVVRADGRAYIGSFGFDLHGGEPPVNTVLLTVDTNDGSHHVAAEDMAFPNGMVIAPDGATLVVGESFGARLTAFAIAEDGALSDRREFASFGTSGAMPDGICLDADGCVWIASPGSRECLRVRDGGEIVARVSTGRQLAIACMLGDEDRRTLYILTSGGLDPAKARELRTGRLESVRVDVPGAGLP